MQTLLQDLRYGARMLWKQPGFAHGAVISILFAFGRLPSCVSMNEGGKTFHKTNSQLAKEQSVMQNINRASVRCILFLALCLHAQAQTKTISLTDPKEFEAFLNPIFAEQMEKLHIPGAAIAVVKDGKIFFSKGYGYANFEKKLPVIPDQTIFRIGSITKVFTATSLVQLADRRKINLNDDVNKYLKDFKIQSDYPQPVTLANLLTHTSGFDEINPGRKTTSADKVIPLGEFLKSRLIRRKPPGEFISYSTYGIALAGYLVETISGAPYKEYLSPEQRLGIFIAANREEDRLQDEVKTRILERYFPTQNKAKPAQSQAQRQTQMQERLARFAGKYRADYYCHTCKDGERGYVPQAFYIEANGDGAISLWGGQWKQVAPLLFQLVKGRLGNDETLVAFREDRNGQITHLFNGTWTHEKLPNETMSQPAPISLTPQTLSDYVGVYEIAANQLVTITLEGDRLMGAMTGQPKVELSPASETWFIVKDANAEARFIKDVQGRVTHLIIRLNGDELRARKIK